MDKRAWFDKIEWEGGPYEAAQYGLTSDDAPAELRKAWYNWLQAVDMIDAVLGQLEDELE